MGMTGSIRVRRGAVLVAVALAGAGCAGKRASVGESGKGGAGVIRPASSKLDASLPANVKDANSRLATAAAAERTKWRGKTFEEFESSVYKEPWPGGKYIVNGDTPILSRKQLEAFFKENVQRSPVELTVNQFNGVDTVWSSSEKKHMTYCVSPSFGSHTQNVLDDMQRATQAWEQCADVKFSHVAAEDQRCDAHNANVVFDVRPVQNTRYYARAFFPNEPRQDRNVLIDQKSFALDPNDKLQLVGVLRHELGHSLGFRHEHVRPEAGTCFEDNDWRPLTSYDAFSVMHYPQCNGGGDWSLTLTARDQSGAACLYGPASGFQPDPTICHAATPSTPSAATTKTFSNQSVAQDQEKQYAAFTVRPGTPFEVTMTGRGTTPGDPDLYVAFGAPPSASGTFDCRPYLDGPNEQCVLPVPANMTKAFVMVHGYTAGRYRLRVKYTPGP